MYTQKIKECDHAFECECVDLAEQGNYLLLPKKFLLYEQSFNEETQLLEINYYVSAYFLKNILVKCKSKDQPIDFLCIVYPNGRVEQWDIKSAKFEPKKNDDGRSVTAIFYIRLNSRKRKKINLKSLILQRV